MTKRWPVLVWIVVLYLLRFDFWNWHSSRLFLGLPVGLAYHLIFCAVVAVTLALSMRRLVEPDATDNPHET